MPRPLSKTRQPPSASNVTSMRVASPAIASSTALSTTSYTRWCNPDGPVEPMYIPGRSRTGSRPLRTVMSFAAYATRAHLVGMESRAGPEPFGVGVPTGGRQVENPTKDLVRARIATPVSVPDGCDALVLLRPRAVAGSAAPCAATRRLTAPRARAAVTPARRVATMTATVLSRDGLVGGRARDARRAGAASRAAAAATRERDDDAD